MLTTRQSVCLTIGVVCGWALAPCSVRAEILVTVRDNPAPPTVPTEHAVGAGSLGTGRFASGEAINLSTAELQAAAGTDSFQLIRIYDDDSLGGATPAEDVGPVTLTASASTTSLPSDIRILIAPPSDDDFQDTNGQWDFNDRAPDQEMAFAGARDFRSLAFASNNATFTTEELRARTRIAAYVTRNLGDPSANPPDRIEAGQVFRLQAISGQATDGNVYADVLGYARNSRFGFETIAHIDASNVLAGRIEAVSSLDPPPLGATTFEDQYASIGRIVVGSRNPSAAGIMGDILATGGSIGRIYTAGPIGFPAPNDPVSIEAGDGIEEIRAIYTDPITQLTVVAERDLHMSLVSNRLMERTDFPYSIPDNDGRIVLLQTDGDLEGSVDVGNITHDTGPDLTGRYGIFVRGTIKATIDVAHNLDVANIVAGRIDGSITIGRAAKGAIVATGAATLEGRIESVEIGYAPIDPVLTPDVWAAYGDYSPGLVGINGCLGTTTFDESFWFEQSFPCDGGAIDGAIRARDSIGTLKLRRMTQRFTGDDVKKHAPRVESPEIGSVEIEDMREGVLWSGLLDFNMDGEILANDYAKCGSVWVGCIGPTADLWVTDVPSLDVAESVYGEIHVPELAADESIRIGEPIQSFSILPPKRISAQPSHMSIVVAAPDPGACSQIPDETRSTTP